jgi:MFS family permease
MSVVSRGHAAAHPSWRSRRYRDHLNHVGAAAAEDRFVTDDAAPAGWISLFGSGRSPTLAVLLGGVLLYAMSALLSSTAMPSAIRDIGGVAYITWPTAAFLAASIAASSGAGLLKARIGARRSYLLASAAFCAGALICALAGQMGVLVAGRFLQGAGGGLLSALSYIVVRTVFPKSMWARAFAMLSGIWGVAVLLGPLVGGAFAGAGYWRGAFFSVAAVAIVLAAAAYFVLPRDAPPRGDRIDAFPALRLGLLAVSIAAMSVAGVAASAATKIALVGAALANVAAMLALDRRAPAPLLPSDAFSWKGVVGPGLWMALLLAIANDPFPIYGPLFLQELHGLTPLNAGYLVALEALSWTVAAVAVAGRADRAPGALLVGGPLLMGAGLAGIGLFMPNGPVEALLVPIFCAGAGIGACWACMAQRVMVAAREGEEDVAASAIATVQLFGLAFGAAVAGLIANLVGYAGGLSMVATRAAAFWVPISFVGVTIAAAVAGVRVTRAWPQAGASHMRRDF